MYRCPACLVENNKSLCVPCGVDADKFPIKTGNLIFEHTHYSVNERKENYDDIYRLYCHVQQVERTFSSTQTIILKFDTTSGKSYKCSSSGAQSFGLIKIKEKYRDAKMVYNVLRQRSLRTRLNYYVGQLQTKGHIDINGGFVDNFSPVKICRDGTIRKGSKVVNLKDANSKNLLKFGKFVSWQERNDYKVVLSNEGLGLFDTKISFEMIWDFDVLRHIIGELANGRPVGSMEEKDQKNFG